MNLKKFVPKKNAAQAIVEFAIVLPILLLLLYGLLEAGRLLFVYSSIVTASRQAARYGSATGMGEDWTSEGGPNNNAVPRYQDCYGIRRAAHRADYLHVVNAFDTSATGDIQITYDNGVDAAGNPIAIAPAWADGNNVCDGTKDTNISPSNNNTTRISVSVKGHFASLVPRIVPFLNRTIDATSARTILMAVSIQVAGAGAGPADPQLANIVDSSSPGAGQPGVTQPGEVFTLTATLNGTAGPAAGTLVFSFNGTVICANVPLVNGVAACSMSLPYTGNVTISYTPTDPNIYNARDFTVLHTVGPADTITTVVATPSQTLPGGGFLVSVLVTNKFGVGTVPTGTVTVSTVGANCSISLSAGQGSCPLTLNTVGTWTLTASYAPADPEHKSSSGTTTHDVVTIIQPPTDTPVPPTAIPPTPIPPTVTPVPGCNTINTKTGAIAISGYTMSLTLKNTGNNYPVTVSNVFLAWNFAAGHTIGDTSLWLQKADANGIVFWSGNLNQPSALLPLSQAVTVPANGSLKITFTFDKVYDRISSSEQIQIQFSTHGCENYPVVRPSNMPTITPVSSAGVKIQLVSGGTDSNQQTQFRYQVQNVGSTPVSNISVRLYFTIDNPNKETDYVLEKFWDQSGVATISGPTSLTNKIFYYTISYGSGSLAPGGIWEFQGSLHLSSWASTYSSTNDFWHTSGALPASYADWSTIPIYVNGVRVWGTEP